MADGGRVSTETARSLTELEIALRNARSAIDLAVEKILYYRGEDTEGGGDDAGGRGDAAGDARTDAGGAEPEDR